MSRARKITVQVPEDLLARARRATGAGTAETVRRGLELVAAKDIYRRLRQLRGRVPIRLDIERLREDRE